MERNSIYKLIIIILAILLIIESVILISDDANEIEFESNKSSWDLPFYGWQKNTTVLGEEENYIYLDSWDDWNDTFVKESDFDSSVHFTPDFENNIYAIAYWGEKPTLGPEINITSISVEDTISVYTGEPYNLLKISVEKNSPVMAMMAISHPIDFVTIPKNQLTQYDVRGAEFVVPHYD